MHSHRAQNECTSANWQSLTLPNVSRMAREAISIFFPRFFFVSFARISIFKWTHSKIKYDVKIEVGSGLAIFICSLFESDIRASIHLTAANCEMKQKQQAHTHTQQQLRTLFGICVENVWVSSAYVHANHTRKWKGKTTEEVHNWSLFLLVRNWADCYLIYLFFTSGRIAFFLPRLWCWAWNTCRYPKSSWRTDERSNKCPNQRTKTEYGDLSSFFPLPSRRYTDHYHICARTYMPSTYLSVCCYNFFFLSYRFQPWNFFSALSMLIIFDSFFFLIHFCPIHAAVALRSVRE